MKFMRDSCFFALVDNASFAEAFGVCPETISRVGSSGIVFRNEISISRVYGTISMSFSEVRGSVSIISTMICLDEGCTACDTKLVVAVSPTSTILLA